MLVDARRVQADRARCPCQPRKSNPLQSCAQSAGARSRRTRRSSSLLAAKKAPTKGPILEYLTGPVQKSLLSPLEKSKVLPESTVQSPQYTGQPVSPDDWAERNGSDIPLFWSESKPIALWAAVIDDWKVATIFDCSPGSGALMEAAMTRSVFYHGLCLVLSS